MKRFILSVLYLGLRFSGIAFVIRTLGSRNKVSILMYHNPEPKFFEKHLRFITRWYNPISILDLMEAYETKDFSKLPKYAVVFSFDDGWKENYHLLPIIKKHQIKPIIFLNTSIVNTHRHYWWTECREEEVESLKVKPNQKKLEILRDKYGFYPEKEFPGDRQALDIRELKELKEYVDFGLHTGFHPILTRCNSEEKQKEILDGIGQLERSLDVRFETFSYPNGDYDEECISILNKANIKLARTTDAGWNDEKTNPYKLKVTGVSDNASLNKLVCELAGISMYFQYFFLGSFAGLKNK